MHFWSKMRCSGNKCSSIMLQYMTSLHNKDPSKENYKWLAHVKSNLDNHGFSCLWNVTPTNINPLVIKSFFKERCIDTFKQNWHSELTSNSQCTIYQKFKKDHSSEKYLKEFTFMCYSTFYFMIMLNG